MLTINQTFNMLSIFLLAFARIGSMFIFNPLFTRKNIPSMVRATFIFWLTIAIYPSIDLSNFTPLNQFDWVVAMCTEFAFGLAFSFIFIIFNYMLVFVGEFMDMQLGLAMSKVFDPGSSLQMSVTGNILNIVFVLFLFTSNSHLVLIQIIADTFSVIKIGTFVLSENVTPYIIQIFLNVLNLCMKIVLPFLAAQFTVEIIMGVLMKVVPQIHVFVINIQVKLLMGFILLFLYAYAIGDFMDKYINTLLDNLSQLTQIMVK